MTPTRRVDVPPASALLVVVLVASVLALTPRVIGTDGAAADVHGADGETRYREVWIDHGDEFRGIKGNGDCSYGGRTWFAEPTPRCGDYPMDFTLDSVAGVSRVEVFLDIWRGRSANNVRFRVNDSDTYTAGRGENWSRTPAVRQIATGDVRAGDNELILEQAAAYHLHDAAFRLYDLAGGDYPDGSGITSVTPAPSGGSITVGAAETITLTADVTGADAVEFIAYYDGFDENNDGDTLDWHSFTRNNWHPGGVNKDGRPHLQGYGTIGHVGTVLSNGDVIVNGERVATGGRSGDTWTIDWDTSLIRNGSPLRFKVRALNVAGAGGPAVGGADGFWVVDALGGATSTWTLEREGSVWVDYAVDPDFTDAVLHHDDSPRYTDAVSRTVTLDLSNATSVKMLGNYWEQPRIHVNPSSPNDNDCGPGGRTVPEDWLTDVMDVTGDVVDGSNVICYEHRGGFGEFIENPGPMFVIRRSAPSGGDPVPVVDAGGPYAGAPGTPIALDGFADDDDPITVRWTKVSGPGSVAFGNDRAVDTSATFASAGTYTIRLTVDDGDDQVNDTATVTVDGPPSVDAGGPYTVPQGTSIALDGTVDDVGPVTIDGWTTVTGGPVAFDDPASVDTTATAPPGVHTVRLTVTDGSGLGEFSADATITVDGAPIADAGGDGFVVLPDTFSPAASVTDDGATTVVWSADADDVTFDDQGAITPVVTFGAPGTVTLTLTVDDGVNPAVTDTVDVTVFDAPPPDLPPTVDAGPGSTVALPGPAQLVGVVTDDGSPVLLWSLVSGPGAVAFGDPAAVATSITFSEPGIHVLRLTVDDGVNAPVTDDVTVVVTAVVDEPDADAPIPTGQPEVGYWMGGAGGDLYAFGDAESAGPVEGAVVAMASTPEGDGLWVLTDDGVVHALAGADHHGNVGPGLLDPGESVASISVLSGGDGYWVFTDRGRALSFGAAPDLEDLVDLGVAPELNGPIVASAATPSGRGAFMAAADGGVFAVGDAVFAGSMGAVPLNAGVVGVVPDPDGEGYWLVAADGGIFAFEAAFQGSMGDRSLNAPVVGAIAFGDGYLLVAADGGIFNFSDQDFLGSLGADPPDRAVRAVAGFPG